MKSFAGRDSLPRAGLRLCLALFAMQFACSVQAGQVLNVTNPTELEKVLSDLIAYGAQGEKSVILKPGDASDDITFAPHMTRLFDAGFEVKRYLVSSTVGNSEFESVIFDVTSALVRELSFLEDAQSQAPLVLALDFEMTNYQPPPPDAVMNFVNGLNPNLPGYFVGTSVNFDSGAVLGAFTGSARFIAPRFDVSVVPEPAAWLAMSMGIIGLAARRRLLTQVC
jgi:hypothetical protein